MALSLKDIRNVLILGCGSLGTRVGLRFALSGYQVKMYDIDQDLFPLAQETQRQLLQYLAKKKLFNPQEATEVTNRITWTTSPEQAVREAHLINESVTEEVDVKMEVWKQFGALSPKDTIFTTNTSYLLPSTFANISGRPDRFCSFHFHDVFHANIVDIMPHATTKKWVVELLTQLSPVLGQVPIQVQKESPGYIFNAILLQVLNCASTLYKDGVGSIEAIDKSWMINLKTNIGPFGMMDAIGLDTAWHIANKDQESRYKSFASLLKQKLDNGELGVKSGQGFYSYPNPRFKDPEFLD